MKERRQARITAALAVIALLAFAPVGAQEQERSSQTTLKGGATYTDQSSQTCEEQNQNNPFTGMNPLMCHGESGPTDSQGRCSYPKMTLWKQVGSTCYYCSPLNPPINGIVIPMDQTGNAENQGFECGLDQADACMVVCSGGTAYQPPSGSGPGGGPSVPLTGGAQQTPRPMQYSAPMPGPAGGIGYVAGANPCIPQGSGYDYCQNGPGARLPAGCVCSKLQAATEQNGRAPVTQPPLTANASDVCAPMSGNGYAYCAKVETDEQPKCGCDDDDSPPPSLSTTTGKLSGSAQTKCQTLLQAAQALPKFSPNDAKTLQQAVADAKTMLAKAKAHVVKWDASAQAISTTYFQSTSLDTKNELSTRIQSELTLLSGMNDPTKSFFTDLWATGKAPPGLSLKPPQKWAAAYVYAGATGFGQTIVFLKPAFFTTAPGASRARLVVHELSHLYTIAGTDDLAYGRSNCSELAAAGELSKDWQWWISKGTFGLNQNGAFPFTLAKPTEMQNPSGYKLVLAPTPLDAAMLNADSFAYFVQDLSEK